MKIEKISGGYARACQMMQLIFFIPFVSFLSYLILAKNFTLDGMVFLFIFIAIIALILKMSFSYADIYVFNDFLVIKKLFTIKRKSLLEIQEVDKSLIPLTYYVKFEDNFKVLFFSSTSDLFKHLGSSDPDKILRAIKSKLSKDDTHN